MYDYDKRNSLALKRLTSDDFKCSKELRRESRKAERKNKGKRKFGFKK